MARIRDIAAVCKSKNAGPFELTIDVVFDDQHGDVGCNIFHEV